MACLFTRLFYVNGGTLAQVQLGLCVLAIMKSCICYEYHSYSPIFIYTNMSKLSLENTCTLPVCNSVFHHTARANLMNFKGNCLALYPFYEYLILRNSKTFTRHGLTSLLVETAFANMHTKQISGTAIEGSATRYQFLIHPNVVRVLIIWNGTDFRRILKRNWGNPDRHNSLHV